LYGHGVIAAAEVRLWALVLGRVRPWRRLVAPAAVTTSGAWARGRRHLCPSWPVRHRGGAALSPARRHGGAAAAGRDAYDAAACARSIGGGLWAVRRASSRRRQTAGSVRALVEVVWRPRVFVAWRRLVVSELAGPAWVARRLTTVEEGFRQRPVVRDYGRHISRFGRLWRWCRLAASNACNRVDALGESPR
jgi:hypothetical protein